MRTVEGELWYRLLVLQSTASTTDASDDGVLDDVQQVGTLAGWSVVGDLDVDLNVGVGVDQRDHTRWTGGKAQLEAVAVQLLCLV